jgi:hypothetical protein
VKVNSPGGAAGPITLAVTITEVSDGSPGDIALASPVSMVLDPVLGGTPTLTCPAAVLTGGGVGGTLTASCTFNNVAVNIYDVTVSIGGNYYTGSASTVLTVYDPSLGFVTGGGTILHNGVTANFGFNVKFNNGSGNARGSFLYIEHRPTGDVRLKSNAMQNLAIVGNSAAIIGKATLGGAGNYSFRATVVDNGEPGGSDQFGLQVTDPSGAPVSDMTFPLTTLSGGSIQVPQGQ